MADATTTTRTTHMANIESAQHSAADILNALESKRDKLDAELVACDVEIARWKRAYDGLRIAFATLQDQ